MQTIYFQTPTTKLQQREASTSQSSAATVAEVKDDNNDDGKRSSLPILSNVMLSQEDTYIRPAIFTVLVGAYKKQE